MWRCVSYEALAPQQVPADLQDYCSVLRQTEPPQDIVRAAIKQGVFLTKEQIRNLWQIEKFEIPGPKQGSGKGGSLLKTDWVASLIKHYFKDIDDTSDEYLKMFNSMMGSTKPPGCAEEVIAAVKALDPISQEDFKHMKEVAETQRQLQAGRKKKPNAAAEPEPTGGHRDDVGGKRAPQSPAEPSPSKQPRTPQAERTRYTPGSLHALLPGKGTLPGVYLKRIPGGTNGKVYQGFYPPSEKDTSGPLPPLGLRPSTNHLTVSPRPV